MASSRVMASSSSAANSDLTRQSNIYSHSQAAVPPDLQSSVSGGDNPAKTLGSISVDDFFRNVGVGNPAVYGYGEAASVSQQQGSFAIPKGFGEKMVEEVWREITGGSRAENGIEGPGGEMTLEDFLSKAGAGIEEDVTVPSASGQGVLAAADPVMGGQFAQQPQQPLPLGNSVLGFGNGVEDGGRGRGSKRQLMDPLDKAALQRQKRMIKNRESAARSRERKQAYTAELESLVAQLEEEYSQLLRDQEEQHQLRLKQLMKNVIPVTEMKKPRRALRRTRSWQW